MDHSSELADIGGVLEDIARSLAIIAADVQEKQHARHIMERVELRRLQGYHAKSKELSQEAKGEASNYDPYRRQVEDAQRAIDLHLEMYPHLKGGD